MVVGVGDVLGLAVILDRLLPVFGEVELPRKDVAGIGSRRDIFGSVTLNPSPVRRSVGNLVLRNSTLKSLDDELLVNPPCHATSDHTWRLTEVSCEGSAL